ncbi:GntR family transcriptional regulator [Pseudarthrobacter sulfonivorans]|uniref:GntR family transcriptional regulator n=1 Tax=Pseudarthrobacter sulfonivorans TaxID=121292 RepID=UPI002103D871|nr:GntR family transcriptional regulator [Pseudarthrobacter sulfonivorans]
MATPDNTPRISARMMAYMQIRERIISGEDAPGTLLSENELAHHLGTSRQPIREALMLIAQEGLVEIRPQSGTYVTYLDADTVAQAQFIREAIEVASLADCASNITPEAAAALYELLDRQDACTSREEFYPLDEDFHRTLLAIAGHETAWATVSNAKGHLDRARYLGLSGYRGITEYAADHRHLLDVLLAGDVPAAQDCLRRHLRFILEDVRSMRASRPELFSAPQLPERRTGRPARV